MSTKAKKIKDLEKKAKYPSRRHHRCALCGRPRAFIRLFGICRLCFRELAHKGELPGVTKASW